jgi:hypothetical protein
MYRLTTRLFLLALAAAPLAHVARFHRFSMV